METSPQRRAENTVQNIVHASVEFIRKAIEGAAEAERTKALLEAHSVCECDTCAHRIEALSIKSA